MNLHLSRTKVNRLPEGSKLTPANTRYDWGMAWMSTVVKKHKRENRDIQIANQRIF